VRRLLIFSLFSIIYSQSHDYEHGGYEESSFRIEAAVDRGDITREQANERYKILEKTLKKNGKRGPRTNSLRTHFERLGVKKDLDEIKDGLMKKGILDYQIESVLSGMVRIIHGVKKNRDGFTFGPRMKVYFQNQCGLNSDQIEYVQKTSLELLE